ncbi:MAG: CDP-glucose 4,6-dehydratase [Candidatus Omnitrophica bacterium]|nr:CDP-glucose 4,6-dehydratase [Candidatus Omnitrophota bacterium]
MFNGVYKGKKVLVTGDTGFKGSWLSLWLSALGAEVLGAAKYLPSQPCHFEVASLAGSINHVETDIRYYLELKKIFDSFQPEIVFHLAAQPIVTTSYDQPQLTFETNVGGTINVLESIRHTPSVKAAVIITSDKCYENKGWDWGYRETDSLGGSDPYSASKACAEIAFSSYFRSYFQKPNMTQIVTVRAGNVIGGGDWAENRIVPDCVRAFSQNKELGIRNPHATRPWLYVLEPLSGYLWLGALLYPGAENLNGESFNFGPDVETVHSVGDLVKSLSEHWGGGKWRVVPSDKKEAGLLKLSFDKALKRIDWMPVLSFQQTMDMTSKWYKQYYAQLSNMKEFSLSQISQYVGEATKKQLRWAQ